MVESKIVNVVATAALGQRVDLENIRKFEEIFYDSDVYGGRVARWLVPKLINVIGVSYLLSNVQA